jgi:prefoldin subunit 5
MEINKLKGELQELRGELQELQTQLQQTQEAKKVLESKFNVKMEEHSKEKSNLNNTIEQFRKDKEELKNSTEQLKKKIKILQTALEETSNQLVQLEQQEKKQKASKYNDNLLIALNDSVREALFHSEIILKIIPENSLVIASEIYDFDGDNNNDFVIIYQDTLGHDKTEMDDYYLSPMIFSGYFFNKKLKSFEEKFHCVDLIHPWDSPSGEEIWMTSEKDTIIIDHHGMTSEHEGESLEFYYDHEDKEFIIQLYHRSAMDRFNNLEDTEDFFIDFKKKTIFSFGEPIEQLNFEAPTLSTWPNGNWKLLSKFL